MRSSDWRMYELPGKHHRSPLRAVRRRILYEQGGQLRAMPLSDCSSKQRGELHTSNRRVPFSVCGCFQVTKANTATGATAVISTKASRASL
nr:unnamed protein product [Callosobruchus analis]